MPLDTRTNAPTDPGACVRASSAHESSYRIQVPIRPARAARVIALDERAEGVAHRLAAARWAAARFYVNRTPGAGGGARLATFDGLPVPLAEALDGADVVVVLATDDHGRDAAAQIGRHCGRNGSTTAGIVLGDGFEADDAVAALRPYARVLLLTADESDAFELLTALRV